MKIRTKSIIDQIELELNKDIEEVTEEDCNTIKDLIINGVNIIGEHQSIYIDDIKYFNNLESISINNMEIDELILETLKGIQTLKSIMFNECEIFDFPTVFFNVTNVEFDFCINYFADILNSFPNVVKLTLKGVNIDYIPKTVKYLNIQKSKIMNYEILNNLDLKELFISLTEYKNNSELYKLLNAKVYDEHDCYLLKEGEY